MEPGMLSASASGYSARDPQVESLVAALDAARLNAEHAGDYMQAEACRRQLAELDSIDDTRQVEALAAEQLAQRLGMDEAHVVELSQLGAFWEHRLFEFDEKARLLVAEMEARHRAELRAFAEQLERPQRATGNVALIDLRRKEANLVRALQYERAARVKAQADALEASVLDKLQQRFEAKHKSLEALLLKRQRTELSALQMRVRAGREEHSREREADELRLMLRYKNLAHDLEAQQRAEQMRLARAPKPARVLPRRGRATGASTPRGVSAAALAPSLNAKPRGAPAAHARGPELSRGGSGSRTAR